jgi:protein SCO1/2
MSILWWLACGGAGPVAREEVPPCHQELPATPAAAEGSLYELELELELASGARTALDMHRGQPVLVAMFYGTCTQACPLTIARIEAILAKLPEEDRREVRVLLVSFDPERDTPAAMTALAARHGLDSRWTLARAPAPQVRELAAALGIKYRALSSGEINHSAVMTLLDADGVPRARVQSLAAPIEPLVDGIAAVSRS